MASRFQTKHTMMVPLNVEPDLRMDEGLVEAVEDKEMLAFLPLTCWFYWFAPLPDSSMALAKVRLGVKAYGHQYAAMMNVFEDIGLRLIGTPKLPNSSGKNTSLNTGQMWPCYVVEMHERSHSMERLREARLMPPSTFIHQNTRDKADEIFRHPSRPKGEFWFDLTVYIPDRTRLERCGPEEGYVNCEMNAWAHPLANQPPINGFRSVRFAGMPLLFTAEHFPSDCPPARAFQHVDLNEFMVQSGYRAGYPTKRKRRAINLK